MNARRKGKMNENGAARMCEYQKRKVRGSEANKRNTVLHFGFLLKRTTRTKAGRVSFCAHPPVCPAHAYPLQHRAREDDHSDGNKKKKGRDAGSKGEYIEDVLACLPIPPP